MKLKLNKSMHIVNGVLGGHPFLNHKNHASGGAYVPIPVHTNVAQAIGRKMKSSRAAVKAASGKDQS